MSKTATLNRNPFIASLVPFTSHVHMLALLRFTRLSRLICHEGTLKTRRIIPESALVREWVKRGISEGT